MKYRFLRYPGGKFKAVTASYDDGSKSDLKLCEILERHGMKCTINLCSTMIGDYQGRLTASDIKKYIIGHGHEIATHGADHKALGHLSLVNGIRDTLDCRLGLEEQFDTIIRGLAYPDTPKYLEGEKYERVREYLKDLDIAYARTTGPDNDGFDLPQDFYMWVPTARHRNEKIFEYIDKFNALEEKSLYCASRWPRLFYFWGHSSEFNSDNNWDRLEAICETLGNREDIWYATNIEIHDYVKAYEALRFSADGKRVYNPTLLDVWIVVGDDLYCVKSGERIDIK
jgi:hypothetical protein